MWINGKTMVFMLLLFSLVGCGGAKVQVTGKVKRGSKAAKRRKSFCARMGGMPGPMKDEKGRPTRKALSLRKWNC